MSDPSIELVKSIFPKWDDVAAFEFDVDNHLDSYGIPQAAKTITFRCRMKDRKMVTVIIE